MLDNIISFDKKAGEDGSNFSSANNLITAWALEKNGNANEAQEYLQQLLNKNSGDAWAQWAMNIYNKKTYTLPETKTEDGNYRVLENWMEMFKK
jgi:hypothetical protein